MSYLSATRHEPEAIAGSISRRPGRLKQRRPRWQCISQTPATEARIARDERMAEVYRDSHGRFASANRATFKEADGKHFIRLWGQWAELKPVTPESFAARMKAVAEAQQRAV